MFVTRVSSRVCWQPKAANKDVTTSYKHEIELKTLVTNMKLSSNPRGTKPSLSFMNGSSAPLLFAG